MLTIVGLGVAGAVIGGVTYHGLKKGWFKKKNPTAAEASGKVNNGPDAAQPK